MLMKLISDGWSRAHANSRSLLPAWGRLAVVLLGGLLGAAPLEAASVLASGNSLWGDPHQSAILFSLGFTPDYVPAFTFGAVSLQPHNAVWLDGSSQYSPGTPGNPGLSAPNLISYMNAGGVVLVENPGFGSEPLSAYPFGDELQNNFLSP